MYIAKNLTKHSLKTIGLHFGGRDHSTVIHAVSTIESYAKEDQSIYEDIQNITQKIELSSL